MDGVPSLWERRYNLSFADSFLARLGDLPVAKTIPPVLPDVSQQALSPRARYAVAPPPYLPPSFSRRPSRFPHDLHPLASSPYLFLPFALSIPPFSFPLPPSLRFFFGSATLPLAARESPLTRRMDDLRISSRSLSPVRSRYRSQSSVPYVPVASAVLSFSRGFRVPSSFFFPLPQPSQPFRPSFLHALSGGGFSTAFPPEPTCALLLVLLLSLSLHRQPRRRCPLCRDAVAL